MPILISTSTHRSVALISEIWLHYWVDLAAEVVIEVAAAQCLSSNLKQEQLILEKEVLTKKKLKNAPEKLEK